MSQTPENYTQPELTQQDREAFWTEHGWTPDLDTEAKQKIEALWTDRHIKEAMALGF
jgi:hypothetical protein